MEAWWHTSGKHPQSSHTEFGGGSGFQMQDDPTGEQTHMQLRDETRGLLC